MKEKTKLWFEGNKTYNILFTDEDLTLVLRALKSLGGEFLTPNEYDKVSTRIYFQMNRKKEGGK